VFFFVLNDTGITWSAAIFIEQKAATALKVPPVPISYIAIYRWAQQALDTRLDHPLLPIFWQKFFTLYLARVPQTEDNSDRGSVGLK
jgi:ectopic P granules protein 5